MLPLFRADDSFERQCEEGRPSFDLAFDRESHLTFCEWLLTMLFSPQRFRKTSVMLLDLSVPRLLGIA